MTKLSGLFHFQPSNLGAAGVSPTLQKVDFKIGTEGECTGYLGKTKYNHLYQMCGVTPGKSVCRVRFIEKYFGNLLVCYPQFCYPQGDSGGPIVRYSSAHKTYLQVGINSFVPGSDGQAQCEKGFAVFMRVFVHRDWIDRNSCFLKDGGLCPTWL
jgi:hypothetical protein